MNLNAYHQEKNETTESELSQLEYLLEKTQEKVNNIIELRQFIMSINSFEEYTRNQNKIVQCLFDVEDNLRESCQVVKKSIVLQRELVNKYQAASKCTTNSVYSQDLSEYDSKLRNRVKTANNSKAVTPIERKQNEGNTYEDMLNTLCYDKYSLYKRIEPLTARGKEIEIDKKEKSDSVPHSNVPAVSVSFNKLKASRVSDLIVKLTSSPDVLEMVSKLCGANILESLLSSTVDNNLIDNVENIIAELEQLKQKDEDEARNNTKKTDQRIFINSSNNSPKRSNDINNSIPTAREGRSTNINPKSGLGSSTAYDMITSIQRFPKTVKSILGTDVLPGNDFNFENSLRMYDNIPIQVFNKYNKTHGDYFDAPLQRGGISILEAQDKLHRSKSKPNCSFNNYSIHSYRF